jgi:SAM-dependent methyltransferase
MIKPETIEKLQAGVPAAFAMLAGMQLEIFSRLADGPRSAEALARELGVSEERLARLLHALVVAGLLELRSGEFCNSAEAAVFLVKDRTEYVGGLHELLAQLWQADLKTAQSVRSGKPAALHDYSAASDVEMATMLRGLHGSALAAGRDLAQRFDFSGCRSVIDIGGGSGGVVLGLCEAYPALHGTLLELPRNARLAADIVAAAPAGDRVSIAAGDIVAEPPRGTYDAAVMRAVVQVLAPADAARAILHAASALRPGGWLYILGGGILDDDRTGPRAAVFLNITCMNLYPSGGAYTEAEYAAWLQAAGCAEFERVLLPSGGSIIRATRVDQ